MKSPGSEIFCFVEQTKKLIYFFVFLLKIENKKQRVASVVVVDALSKVLDLRACV